MTGTGGAQHHNDKKAKSDVNNQINVQPKSALNHNQNDFSDEDGSDLDDNNEEGGGLNNKELTNGLLTIE